MTAPVRPDRILRKWWDALPEETRTAIEVSIPEGSWITLTAGYRAKPGTADARLYRGGGEVVAEMRGRDLAYLCRALLAVPALRVTVDSEGYITDLEDVA